jgi:hypothetical protein
MSKTIDGDFPKDGSGINVCSKISALYLQENNLDDNMNELHLETQNDGAGDFFIMKTERWLFDDIDELIKTLKHFKTKKKNEEDMKT